jgi:hypothetical protein
VWGMRVDRADGGRSDNKFFGFLSRCREWYHQADTSARIIVSLALSEFSAARSAKFTESKLLFQNVITAANEDAGLVMF